MLFYSLFRNDPSIRRLRAGDILFREGDAGDCMYVVLAGGLDVSVHGRIVDTVEYGQILGEMALLEKDSTRSATATAQTDCELVEVTEKRFLYLVSEAPHFAVEVMKTLAHRLRRADELIC